MLLAFFLTKASGKNAKKFSAFVVIVVVSIRIFFIWSARLLSHPHLPVDYCAFFLVIINIMALLIYFTVGLFSGR